MAAQVVEEQLDDQAIARIYQATEGSPLFIVETMRANGWYERLVENPLTSTQPKIAALLPPKVQATIQHRLNQLSPAARVLTATAAVIGRSFTFPLLQAVSDTTERELLSSLDELWQRGIVRTDGDQIYDFSHDRIREVAYTEIGPVQRPHLHRRVADTLCQLCDDDLDSVAAHLATHYDAAGVSEEAINWYQRAADVQLMVLSRAMELAEEVNDNVRLYYCLINLRGHYLSKGGPAAALDFSPQLLRVGETTGNPLHLAGARYMVARAYIHHGDFQQAHTRLTQAYSPFTSTIYSNRRGVWHGAMTGVHHPKLCANLGIVLWLLGYPEQARPWLEEALQFRVQEKTHLFHDSATLHFCVIVFRALNNVAQVQSLAEQMIMIGTHYGQNLAHLNGLNFQGWVLAQLGDFAGSIDSLRQGIAGFRAINQTMFQTYRLAILAETYLLTNDLAAAATTLDEAFAISVQGAEFWWDAELHRLRGNLYLAQGVPFAQVERCYEQAITIAQQQSAKSLELRAIMSLARLWQQQGNVRKAHSRLSRIYSWFTEGFQTADLQAARNLLVELF